VAADEELYIPQTPHTFMLEETKLRKHKAEEECQGEEVKV